MVKKSLKRPLLENEESVISRKYRRKGSGVIDESSTNKSLEAEGSRAPDVDENEKPQREDYRLINDVDERDALEATVFGEGFVGETDSEESDDETEIKDEEKLDLKSPNLLEDSSDDADHGKQAREEGDNAVWKDSDDEEIEVDLNSHTKLKKLRNAGNVLSNLVITAKDYQKRLKAFHARKSHGVAEAWVQSLKTKWSEDHENESSENDIDNLEEQSKIRSRTSKFISSSVPILDKRYDRLILSSSKLPYRILPDGNRTEPSNCPLKCSGFVPQTNLLYAAGRDKTIRIFNIDRKNNPKLASIYFKDAPIRFATAVPSTIRSGPSVYFLTHKKTLGYLDVESNKASIWSLFGSRSIRKLFQLATRSSFNHQQHHSSGDFAIAADNSEILLCDMRSQSFVRSYKMNGKGTALSFNPKDSNRLFSGDSEGMVYEWDLTSSRCVQRFHDEGSTCVVSMSSGCFSQSDESAGYLAIGSHSGYVNIYDISNSASMKDYNKSTSFLDDDLVIDQNPYESQLHFESELLAPSSYGINREPIVSDAFQFRKPLKALGHLTTSITSLAFHPTCKILAMSSKWTKEGIKLAHLPYFTIYSNFPNQNGSLKLHYPTSISFNDCGSLMSIGNDHGQIKLIQLTEFLSRDAKRKQR